MLQISFIMKQKILIELLIILFYLFCTNCYNVENNTHKMDFFLSKELYQYEINIICCRNEWIKFKLNEIHNCTYFLIDNKLTNDALQCKKFHVSYYTNKNQSLNEYKEQEPIICSRDYYNYEYYHDCSKILNCNNKNVQSRIDSQTCECFDQFFGENCEKECIHGVVKKNFTDRCFCHRNYYGEDCSKIICLNGGREINGSCICLPPFTGNHCDMSTKNQISFTASIDDDRFEQIYIGEQPASVGSGGSRFQRYNEQLNNEMFTRDISGTIFSLIMIIVLVVSMYLLMKHRMQACYVSRRPDLLGACNFVGDFSSNGTTSARRVELIPNIDDERHIRNFPFSSLVGSITNHFIANDGGPPPYFPPGYRPRRNCDDILPPLPSYEDATKLPHIRQNADEQNNDLLSENRSADNNVELSTRQTQHEINNIENNVPYHLAVQSCAIDSRISQEENEVVRSIISNNNSTGNKRKLSNQDAAFSFSKEVNETGNNISSINKTQSLNEVSCTENNTNELKRPETDDVNSNFVGTSNELHEIDENQRHTTV